MFKIKIVFGLIFMCMSCINTSFSNENNEFELYLSKFKDIEIPHSITNKSMQKLLKNYSFDNTEFYNDCIDSNFIRRITADVLKINPDKLEVVPIYYPYGKYKINNLIFTIIFYIGNEDWDDDYDPNIKSYVVEIWTFDTSGKFTDYTQIGKCFGSYDFFIECNILEQGDLEVTSTNKSTDKKTGKQIVKKDTDKYKLDMDLMEFKWIKPIK